ncbi:DUF485 domain-containing protein [Chloroflexota bacterium]
MKHAPATKLQTDKTESFKTKFGLVMVIFYTVVYFAFIVLCVTNPQLMAKDVGSLNLAITYGFGLIIIAIIQALIYNYVCAMRERGKEDVDRDKRKRK